MSLQFNVSQLLKTSVGKTREYDFESDEPLDLDDSVARSIHGHVKFTLTNFGILAAVRAEGELELVCARCLDAFTMPAQVSFDEEYQPSIDIGTGLPSAQPRTEGAFEISATHVIDLTEALRQHFLLAVELVPVCQEACKGLCPTCGTNLNHETCDCPPPQEHNPFAALSALLQEPESES